MTDTNNPEVSSVARPRDGDLCFDLSQTLDSVVGIRSSVPESALTASVLGTERAGHGVVISDEGHVLTIGYLVTEAQSVWLTDRYGRSAQAHVVGYDQGSGFGLVQSLQPMDLPVLALGESSAVQVGEPVIVAAHGGINHALQAEVIDRREFAGYWEYVLDDAIFTAPAHPSWGGSALISMQGTLVGLGSLLLQSQGSDTGDDTNLFVPIDLLKAIFENLKNLGSAGSPPRPWLGVFVYDVGEELVVAGVFNDCPAHRADLRPGDLIVAVDGTAVASLAGLFRRIWSLGEAGVVVPLRVMRDSQPLDINVQSETRRLQVHTGTLH